MTGFRPAARWMLAFGFSAILLDAYTTIVAIQAGRFHEHTPQVAGLIHAHGLILGVVMAALIRMLVLALVAMLTWLIEPRWPLILVGFAGGAFTLWIALGNIHTMAVTG